MTLTDLLITVLVLCFLFSIWTRITRGIRKLFGKLLKRKQSKAETDSKYCLLRISPMGELIHQKFSDESKAREAYKTAVNFNEGNGSYIALFNSAVLIDNN